MFKSTLTKIQISFRVINKVRGEHACERTVVRWNLHQHLLHSLDRRQGRSVVQCSLHGAKSHKLCLDKKHPSDSITISLWDSYK